MTHLRMDQLAASENGFPHTTDLAIYDTDLPFVERLLAAIDSISEGFVLLDDRKTVVHANVAMKSFVPSLRGCYERGADFSRAVREGADRGLLRGTGVHELREWLQMEPIKDSIAIRIDVEGDRSFELKGSPIATGDLAVMFTDGQSPAEPRGFRHLKDPSYQSTLNSMRRLGRAKTVTRSEFSDALSRVEMANRALAREVAERRQLERELRRLADTDGLTGIANRRYFLNYLQSPEFQQEVTDGTHALLMIDVDHFKTVNDAHGHRAGDEALNYVVETTSACLPRNSLLARIGGEEFALLVCNTDRAKTTALAESIRSRINQTPFRSGEDIFVVSVSIGGLTFTESPPDALHLLTVADRALYRAKREGRNRICIIGSDAEQYSMPVGVPNKTDR